MSLGISLSDWLFETGKMLACDHEDVKPDILVLGKALSGTIDFDSHSGGNSGGCMSHTHSLLTPLGFRWGFTCVCCLG